MGWRSSAAFFVSAAGFFEVKTRFNIGVCLLVRPECSIAFATWMLCLITGAAFIAAYEAARKAGETLRFTSAAYELETALLLGVWLCSEPNHKIARAELYVVDDRLEPSPRAGYSQDAYVGIDFDFENLGRSAFRNLIVPLQLDDNEPVNVRIGNIGLDKDAHVVLFFEWDLLKRPTVAWLSPALESEQPLDYTPLPRLRVARSISQSKPSTIVRRIFEKPQPRKWDLSFIDVPEPIKADDVSLKVAP